MPVGDDRSLRVAKALALPTRSAILNHLLKAGSLTAREIADEFDLHPNVARVHLDLLVEAGFLATGSRRQGKGRPAKVYFTWESEVGTPDEWDAATAQPDVVPDVPGTVIGVVPEAEPDPIKHRADPFRMVAAIFVRLTRAVDRVELHAAAEEVAREEGHKMMLGYRHGGLDFAAAIRALVEELRRYSEEVEIVRIDLDHAEIRTMDCPFRHIALEHADLVSVIDPALKEGAMEALGHKSDVETIASVSRGDAYCHESIRKKPESSRRKRSGHARKK